LGPKVERLAAPMEKRGEKQGLPTTGARTELLFSSAGLGSSELRSWTETEERRLVLLSTILSWLPLAGLTPALPWVTDFSQVWWGMPWQRCFEVLTDPRVSFLQ
jgi:hypothetical protein